MWVPLILMLAIPVQAATLSGRASTVAEWFDTAEEETALPFYQYLQFSLMDMGGKGYNFKAYGRLADDLQDEVDIDSRLYYAYVEKKDLLGRLDLRLGRQFITTTAGASLMDGLRFDYRFLDNYSAKLYGGGDVTYYENYTFDANGVFGVELGGLVYDEVFGFNLSYLQKWREGVLGQELAGLDLSYDIDGKLWAYGEFQYDVLSERMSYALTGAKYRFDNSLSLRLEYLYSLPVFVSTSIYSVFAVDEYEELLAETVFKISPSFQSYFRYVHEMYVDFEDADVFEAGIEKLRTGRVYGYVSGIYRLDEDGQDLGGVKAYMNYKCGSGFSAGMGANVDVLERSIAYFDSDDSEQDETTSTRLWVDAKMELTKSVNLEAKYEYIESDLYDYYNRGRVRLNVLF
ncbi:MAG: hypothetical protein C0614_00725 [Desulfuromonas sp.]|nr:MAG: hypothetical protein C0614_00725 [Desulfuromonas sp.]